MALQWSLVHPHTLNWSSALSCLTSHPPFVFWDHPTQMPSTDASLRAHRALQKTKGPGAVLLDPLLAAMGWRVTWLNWTEATAWTLESG